MIYQIRKQNIFWKRIKVAIGWNRMIFDENIFEEELKLLLF